MGSMSLRGGVVLLCCRVEWVAGLVERPLVNILMNIFVPDHYFLIAYVCSRHVLDSLCS